MLNKAQLDALVIDGDGHDEDVIALLAHARESLTAIARLRGALEQIQVTTQEPATEKLCEDALGQAALAAPTEPTSAEPYNASLERAFQQEKAESDEFWDGTEPTSAEDEPEQTPAEKRTGEKLLKMYRDHRKEGQ